jgi:hypothetical protein
MDAAVVSDDAVSDADGTWSEPDAAASLDGITGNALSVVTAAEASDVGGRSSVGGVSVGDGCSSLVVGGDATSPVGAVSVGGVGSPVGAVSAETRRAPTPPAALRVISVVGLVTMPLRSVPERRADCWLTPSVVAASSFVEGASLPLAVVAPCPGPLPLLAA